MRDEVEILQRQAWSNESLARYQILDARALLAELRGPSESLLADLLQHRALLVRWDRFFNPDYEEIDPEALTSAMGQPMTYREWWDLVPSDRPHLWEPEWETWALLLLDLPFFEWQGATMTAWDLGRALYQAGAPPHVIALRIDDRDEDLPTEWDLSGSPFTSDLFTPARVQASPQGWDFGPDLALTYQTGPGPVLRDWTWAWSQTYGPAQFTVKVDRTREQLEQWMKELDLHCYQPIWPNPLSDGDHLSLMRGRKIGLVGDVYEPQREGLRLKESKNDGTWSMRLFDGRFSFYRDYGSPPPAEYSTENTLLEAVLSGQLGEAEWDLFDGDYYVYQAQGPGLASLRAYLNPSIPREALQDSWNLSSVIIDCADCSTWLEVRRQVATHFRIPTDDQTDSRQVLVKHLATLRAGQYPRSITVSLPFSLEPSLGGSEVMPPAPSIVWSFAHPSRHEGAPAVSVMFATP